jgi:hypothetical protein
MPFTTPVSQQLRSKTRKIYPVTRKAKAMRCSSSVKAWGKNNCNDERRQLIENKNPLNR